MRSKFVSLAVLIILLAQIGLPILAANASTKTDDLYGTAESPAKIAATQLVAHKPTDWSKIQSNTASTLYEFRSKDNLVSTPTRIDMVVSKQNDTYTKFSIDFVAPKDGQYVLYYTIRGFTGSIRDSPTSWTFGYSDGQVTFDWSDLSKYNLDISASVNANNVFEFTITFKSLKEGERISLDPTLLATDSYISHFYQHHLQYMNGRWWMFYSNGAQAVYNSTADGISYVGAQLNTFGILDNQRISTDYNGTHIAVICLDYVNSHVMFRMGIPHDDGTITWLAAWQDIYGSSSEVTIAFDYFGYTYATINTDTEHQLIVQANTKRDGTWSNGLYKLLVTSVDTEGVVIPTLNGILTAVYVKTNVAAPLYYQRYEAGVWGPETQLSPANIDRFGFTTQAVYNTVFLTYVLASNGHGYFTKYIDGIGGWYAVDDVTGVALVGVTSIVKEASGKVWMEWGTADKKIWFSHYNGYVWTAPISPVTEPVYTGGECVGELGTDQFPLVGIIFSGSIYFDVISLAPSTVGIYGMDGCGPWLHVGKDYTFHVNVTIIGDSGISDQYSAGIGFYDSSLGFYSFYYDNATQRVVITNPSGVIGVNVRVKDIVFGSNYLFVNFTVSLTTKIYDTADVDLYARFTTPNTGDSGWVLNGNNYFNIYNIGGLSIIQSTGTAGRIAGGQVFELYASSGGTSRVNSSYQAFQSFHTLFDVAVNDQAAFSDYADKITFTYGLSYCIDDEWHDGFNITIRPRSIVNGAGLRIITWNVNWTDTTGALVRSDIMATYPFTSSGTGGATSSMILDFWIPKVGSAMSIGGRFTSKYYAVFDSAGWWGWLVGSNWGPQATNVTQSMVSVPILDALSVNRSARDITGYRLWCRIEQPTNANGYTYTLTNYDVFDVNTNTQGFSTGIDTPVFIKTIMPAIDSGGLFSGVFQALMSFLAYVSTLIVNAIWLAVSAIGTFLLGSIDGIFAWFGWGPTWASTGWAGMILLFANINSFFVAQWGNVVWGWNSIIATFWTFWNFGSFVVGFVDTLLHGATYFGALIGTYWTTLVAIVPLAIIFYALGWIDSTTKEEGVFMMMVDGFFIIVYIVSIPIKVFLFIIRGEHFNFNPFHRHNEG